MFNFAKIEDLHTDLIGLHINLILFKKYYLEHNCDIRHILNKFKDTSKDELKDKLLNEFKNKELFDIGLLYFFFYRMNNNQLKTESELYINRRDFALKICDYVHNNKDKLKNNIFEMYECLNIDMVNLMKNIDNYYFDLTYDEFNNYCSDFNNKSKEKIEEKIEDNTVNDYIDSFKTQFIEKIYESLKKITKNDIKNSIRFMLISLFNISFNFKRKLRLNKIQDDKLHFIIQTMIFEDSDYFTVISKPLKLVYNYDYEDYIKYVNYIKENLDPNVVIQEKSDLIHISDSIDNLDSIDILDEEFGDLDEFDKDDIFNDSIIYGDDKLYVKTKNWLFNYKLGVKECKEHGFKSYSDTLYPYKSYYTYIKMLLKNTNDQIFLYDDNILKSVKKKLSDPDNIVL